MPMKKTLLFSLFSCLTLTAAAAKDTGTLFREADQLAKEKKYDELVKLFNEIDAYKPSGDLWAVYLRAARYFARQENAATAEKAAPLLNKALANAGLPDRKADVLFCTAEMELNCGKRDKAKETLKNILTIKDLPGRKKMDAIERLANFEPQYKSDMSKFEAVWRTGFPIAGTDPDLRSRIYRGIADRCNAYWIKDRETAKRIYREAADDKLLRTEQRTDFLCRLTGFMTLNEAESALLPLLAQKDLNDAARLRIHATLYGRYMNDVPYLGTVNPASVRKALVCCDEILKLPKVNIQEYKCKKAEACLALGHYEEALTLAREGKSPLTAGNVLFAQEKYEEALAEYREAMKTRKFTKQQLNNVAECHMALKNYPAVLEILRQMEKAPGRWPDAVYIPDWIAHVRTLIPAAAP